MADTGIKISALPQASSAGGEDVVIVHRKADGTHIVPLKDVQLGAVYEANLKASGWTGSAAPYTQTVTVTGVSAEGRYMLASAFDASASATITSKAYAKAYAIIASGYATVADNAVTFTVYKKPAVDLTIKLVG